MRFLIDTSSLVSLARYYLAFENKELVNFFKEKFASGDFVLLDEVYKECELVAKGIVLEKLPFLADKYFLKLNHLPSDTSLLFPYKQKQFFHYLNSDFKNSSAIATLKKEQIESLKDAFLKSADFMLILTAWNGKHKNSENNCCIVTEETGTANDNKLFRKIPKMCAIAELEVMNLTDLLKNCQLNVEVK